MFLEPKTDIGKRSADNFNALLDCLTASDKADSSLLALDSAQLLSLANAHLMVVPLYRRLKHCGAGHKVPALFCATEALVSQEMLLSATLARLAPQFAAAGIRALAFKGPALAAQIYKQPENRQFGDLDLLIAKADFSAASELLFSLGYRLMQPLNAAQLRSELYFQNAIEFLHPESGVVVDLHWKLVRNFYGVEFNFEQLWSRHEMVAVEGHPLPTLSKEDLLLVLAVHGGKHGWSKLVWVADIRELLENVALDWDYVARQARALQIERMLSLALGMASRVYALSLPADAAKFFPRVNSLEVQCLALLEGTTSDSVWKECLRDMRMREDFFSRIRYLCFRLLTPHGEDWRFLQLPLSLFPLYYLVRPLRLGLRYAGRVFKRRSER